jgi:chemotaxis protein CheD
VNAVARYHDSRFDVSAIKLLPADLVVCDNEDVAIVTVLGSCVSACLRDAEAGIGGMNHFMLPDNAAGDVSARYGSHAMELLINGMLKAGARRDRIEAKVFGGGNVLKGFLANPVGTRNAQFVLEYLRTERIPIIAEDLYGIHPRKVWFFPVSGRVVVQRLPHAHETAVVREENAYRERIAEQPRSGGVELFG